MEREAQRRRADALDRFWDDALADGATARPDDVGEAHAQVVHWLTELGQIPGRALAQERIWARLADDHRTRHRHRHRPEETAMFNATALPIDQPSYGANSRHDALPHDASRFPLAPGRRGWAVAQLATAALLLVTLITSLFAFGVWPPRAVERVPIVATQNDDAPAPVVEGIADVPMYRGDPARSGVMPGPGPVGEPGERWRFQIEGPIKSAPAIVGGMLYVGGGDGEVYALDAATGAERWRFATGAAVSSSPAVSDGRVYIGSDDGVLHALDAASGEAQWSFPGIRPEASPAALDDTVYAGSEDGHLYAIDGTLGTERWRAALGDAASRSVAVADGLVYVGSADGVLHAVAADSGQEQWQFQTAGGTLITPAVAEGTVYQATNDGDANQLYALDATTGGERWTFATPDGAGVLIPAIGGGMVYLPSADSHVYALDAATGQERWRFATGDKVDASPALVGETLYVAGKDRTLYALDATTGEEHWRFALDGAVGYGPTVTGGVAYLGTSFGALYAIGGAETTTLSAVATAPFEFLWRTTGGPEPLTYATGLAFDADGNVWVADAGRNRFQIFSPDGEYLETWGEAGSGDGQFNFLRPGGEGITDIDFAPDGSFYVADSNNFRVQHFAADRTFLHAIGSFGGEDGQFREPIGVDVDAAGNLYVIDDQRDDVQKFDAEGNFLLKFSGHGSEDGQLNGASWGAIDPQGNLWVTDSGNNRVQQFAPDGTFLQRIGSFGDGEGEFDNPQTVTVDAEGRVFVGDLDNGRVQVFDASGQFIASLTGDDAGGPRFGNVGHVELDGEGNLYVGEYSEEEGYEAVQKFRLLPPLT